MGKLAFLPWLSLDAEFEVGDFRLVPYHRGEAPGVDAGEQAAIDKVLSAYRDLHGKPIDRATVIRHSAQESPSADFSESLHLDFFVFVDLLAFAGLAARRFFGHFEYTNRDSYRLVLQQFSTPGRGVLVTTRRRDGGTNMFYSGDTFVVYRPHHVGSDPAKLDEGLLHALVAAMSDEQWPRLYQGVLLFNEANTDRIEVPQGTELIMTYAALEQLLDSAGRPPAEVARVFSDFLSPREDLERQAWKVAHGNDRAQRLLDSVPNLRTAWLLDLGISRGSVAHGHATEAYPACWQLHEHLLFGAHVVPLALKRQLHALGYYSMTDDDIGGVEVLEALLNEDHFEYPESDNAEREKRPWLRIIDGERIRRWVHAATERYPRGGNAAS